VNKNVIYKNIGLIEYKEAWDYQESLFDEIVAIKERNRKVEVKSLHIITCYSANTLMYIQLVKVVKKVIYSLVRNS